MTSDIRQQDISGVRIVADPGQAVFSRLHSQSRKTPGNNRFHHGRSRNRVQADALRHTDQTERTVICHSRRKVSPKKSYLTGLPIRASEFYFSFFSSDVMLTLSLMILCRSSIFTLSCVMVSRSRTVTQWSLRESWSTVTQNGVPMAS